MLVCLSDLISLAFMFVVIIIGAGIVGLSTAYKLLEKYSEIKILIIEKENNIAQHQTGNNSGVIHSGLYYKPGSLKAINCVKGYDMMINFWQNQVECVPYFLLNQE